MRTMLYSKIHRARVTEANIDYEGSISMDRELMEAADILPFEMVHVLDVNNGARLQTYAIEGDPGEICINGAAARLVYKGDTVIILCYHQMTDDEAKTSVPRLVYVDSQNRIVKKKEAYLPGRLGDAVRRLSAKRKINLVAVPDSLMSSIRLRR